MEQRNITAVKGIGEKTAKLFQKTRRGNGGRTASLLSACL